QSVVLSNSTAPSDGRTMRVLRMLLAALMLSTRVSTLSRSMSAGCTSTSWTCGMIFRSVQRLSNPGRVVFPDLGLTKLDLARYHDSVSEWELPHLRGRPLTLLRCGGAIGPDCHFMKHSKVW